MATLERIRKRSGLLIVVIGLAMLAFILTDLFSSGGAVFSGDATTVGKVNGRAVEIQEFNQKMDEVRERVAMQNPEQLNNLSRKQLADAVWDEILREEIMGEQYDELGITVTPAELYDRLKSDPNVQGAFKDPNTGQFSEASFNQYLTEIRNNAPLDEQSAMQYEQWLAFETGTRNMVESRKYNVGVEKGLYVPTKMAAAVHRRESSTTNVNFIALEYATIADSTVNVSEADIKKYYNENKEDYKSEETASIEYVNFPIAPSAEDRTEVINELKQFKQGTGDSLTSFASAEDDSAFADMRSDLTPISPTWYRESNLPPALDTNIFDQEAGYVTEPYLDGNYYKITKVSEIAQHPDSVKARHILISFAGANQGQSESQRSFQDAKALADSLAGVLKADTTNFGSLATEYSDDPGSASRAGELGWFGPASMVKPFSDFSFENETGDIDVVLSRFGYHIIEILDQKGSEKAMKLVSISREIAPSDQTYDNIYNTASTFASEVRKSGVENFGSKAAEMGYTPRPITGLAPFDEMITGLGNNREVIRWAHNEETAVGDITLMNSEDQNSFVVVVLTDRQEEGYASLESVSDAIRPEVIKEKKAEVLKSKMNSALEGKTDLAAAATELNVQVRNAALNFASATLPGYGNEPEVIGAMTAAEGGAINGPVAGNMAVYAYTVLSRTPATELPDYTAQQQEQQMMIRPRVTGQVFNSLKEEADITDRRSEFF